MKTARSLYQDVFTGAFFFLGTFSFMSGEFVLSTLLFGTASLLTNVHTAKAVRT